MSRDITTEYQSWMANSAYMESVAGAPTVAKELHLPLGTSSNALQRLQKKGKEAMLSFRQYVVVDLAEQ
jgi:hypothetical protein